MRIPGLVVAAFMMVGSASAQESQVKVPFLFSADEKVPSIAPLSKAISKSDALRTDAYLNAPMTRLEYILTRIEAELNDSNGTNMWGVLDTLKRNFEKERTSRYALDPVVKGKAIFYEAFGKVMIAYDISTLGRPRKAMKETCDDLLSLLSFDFPYEPRGAHLHSRLLGVLWQKSDLDYYTPTLQRLAENFVLKVSLQSQTEKGKVNHYLICQKEKDAETVYRKYSFRLN